MKQYFGNYLGLCIDNNDPQKRGRVQVFIPHVLPALFKDWNELGEDIEILCVGNNVPNSLPAPIIEKLKKILPWAEAASPIMGTSAPGSLANDFYNQSPVAVSNCPDGYSPSLGSSEGTYVEGNIGPTSTGPHFDIKQVGRGFFDRSNLDSYVQVNGRPLSSGTTVPGGRFGAARSYGKHQGWDYAFGGGTNLTLTNGARWVGTPRPTANGDLATFQLPDGRQFEVLHGKFIPGNSGPTSPGNNRSITLADGTVCYENTSTSSQINNTAGLDSSLPLNQFASVARPETGNVGGGGSYSFTNRTVTANGFSVNSDGNTRFDTGLSPTYQGQTASGIPNDSEILGYTIPLDSSLTRIQRDGSGNPVANVRQPAIVTFTNAQGSQFKVLAVGNDTGGRQLGSSTNRGWGEFGTNTYRALQQQGLDVRLGYNSISMPPGTTASYQFLDGSINSVEEYRSLQSRLQSQGLLGTSQTAPIGGATPGSIAGEGIGNGLPQQSGMVLNPDTLGPSPMFNINNMAGGMFSYPAAGALLWVFFREGNPLFPVYFAANYGEREWASAYRLPDLGTDGEGYKPSATAENPVTSVGGTWNIGKVGAMHWVDRTDPRNPLNNEKTLLIGDYAGSNITFNQKGMFITSATNRRDQVQLDRHEITQGNKEVFVQGDISENYLGRRVIRIGNTGPEAVAAAEEIAGYIDQIMAPLAVPKVYSGGNTGSSGFAGAPVAGGSQSSVTGPTGNFVGSQNIGSNKGTATSIFGRDALKTAGGLSFRAPGNFEVPGLVATGNNYGTSGISAAAGIRTSQSSTSFPGNPFASNVVDRNFGRNISLTNSKVATYQTTKSGVPNLNVNSSQTFSIGPAPTQTYSYGGKIITPTQSFQQYQASTARGPTVGTPFRQTTSTVSTFGISGK